MHSRSERLYYRLTTDPAQYSATITASEGGKITLLLCGERPADLSKGRHLIVSDHEGDSRAEVTSLEGDILSLVKTGSEQREYFRVDDVLPVQIKTVEMDPAQRKSGILGLAYPEGDGHKNETPDETISPQLWQMLTNMNAKIEMILAQLQLEREKLVDAERKPVNLSATGIRVTVKEKVTQGEIVEVKLLLSSSPPMGILVYGQVVRSKKISDTCYEVAIHFSDIAEDVKDEIIKYALSCQRETIRVRKQQCESDAG